MKYGIVVDSGCDLRVPPAGEGLIDFTRVPLKLDIGEQQFVDDFDLDVPGFMAAMYAHKGRTGSAAPSPHTWLSAYEKSENVFVITITGSLSGSFASAQVAAKMFREQYPERNIYLIDSKSAGAEISLLAHRLAELMLEGLEFSAIRSHINEYQRRTYLLFALQSMENLIKNGRVSRLAGNIAGILGIKILGIASDEGTLELLHKLRGKLKVYDKMIAEMLERGYNGGRVIIGHCFNQEAADYLAENIRSRFRDCEIHIMPTSGLCSYYAERGGILLGFEGAKR
ncbi:MAG: DegV family protein [Candidatus Heteroscillospira sp.]|jgi:DegV family protein with EDD domain